MEFSRQVYKSGLSFPSPGDLPNPGIKPGSPAFQADALTSEPPGKLELSFSWSKMKTAGGSISDSPERLLQSSSGGKSIYKDFGEGGVQCHEALILQKVFVSHEDLMSP